MKSVVVDSGPLIALFDGSDRYHAQAVVFVRDLRRRLVTNLPAITEVIYMLNFAPQAQRDFLFWGEQSLTSTWIRLRIFPAYGARSRSTATCRQTSRTPCANA